MKSKRVAIVLNMLLLIWFFLDMVGVTLGEKMLVSRAWQEDGVFFLLFLTAFLWFLLKEKLGKYILTGILTIWLILQLYFHWVFTVFGPWEGKIRFFSGTIKLFESNVVYIPDLYHIILHILILCALISVICFIKKSRSV
jgi:hypothetical protein